MTFLDAIIADHGLKLVPASLGRLVISSSSLKISPPNVVRKVLSNRIPRLQIKILGVYRYYEGLGSEPQVFFLNFMEGLGGEPPPRTFFVNLGVFRLIFYQKI